MHEFIGSTARSRGTDPGPPPGYTTADSLVAPLEGLLHDPGAPLPILQRPGFAPMGPADLASLLDCREFVHVAPIANHGAWTN